MGSGGDPVADAELELAQGAERERQVADEASVAREGDRALELATSGVVVLHPAREQAQVGGAGTPSSARAGGSRALGVAQQQRIAASALPGRDEDPPERRLGRGRGRTAERAGERDGRLGRRHGRRQLTLARLGERRSAQHHRRASRIAVQDPRGTRFQDIERPARGDPASSAVGHAGSRRPLEGPRRVPGRGSRRARPAPRPRARPARDRAPVPAAAAAPDRRRVRCRSPAATPRPPRRRAARASGPGDAGQRGGDVRVRPVAGLGEVPGRALGLTGLAPGPRERLVREPALRRRGDLERGGLRERMREPWPPASTMRQPAVDARPGSRSGRFRDRQAPVA